MGRGKEEGEKKGKRERRGTEEMGKVNSFSTLPWPDSLGQAKPAIKALTP